MNSGIDQVNEQGIERMAGFCNNYLINEPDINYFIFGHIHMPKMVELDNDARYFSIGDWVINFSYLVFDGNELKHKFYK